MGRHIIITNKDNKNRKPKTELTKRTSNPFRFTEITKDMLTQRRNKSYDLIVK